MNDQHRKPSRLNKGLAFESLKDTAPTGDLVEPTQTPPPAAPAPAPAPAPKPKKPKRQQVTYYHQADALTRAKQADLFTRGHTGYKSWSDFVEAAVNQHAYKLEEQYNERRPFGS